jgi:hypothetical protein
MITAVWNFRDYVTGAKFCQEYHEDTVETFCAIVDARRPKWIWARRSRVDPSRVPGEVKLAQRMVQEALMRDDFMKYLLLQNEAVCEAVPSFKNDGWFTSTKDAVARDLRATSQFVDNSYTDFFKDSRPL